MATNDFLVWAGSGTANVLTQADYAALANRPTGDVTGVAASNQANKSWRQASIMAATLAQAIADGTGQNSVDDGTTATLENNFFQLFRTYGYAADTGTPNVLVIALSPAPPSLASLVGALLRVRVKFTNTGGDSNINVNGSGAVQILNPDGKALIAGQLIAGTNVALCYDGTFFRLIGGSAVIEGPAALINGVADVTDVNALGGLVVNGQTVGAAIKLVGNGAVTPKKWIRAINGILDVVNDAYNGSIMALSDLGDLFNLRSVTAAGTVQGNFLASTGGAAVAGTLTAGAVGANTVTGGTVNSNGNVNAAGALNGASASVSGNVTAGGTVTGATVNSSGNMNALNTVAGAFLTSSGNVAAAATVSGAFLTSSGSVNANGTFIGGAVAVNGNVSGLALSSNNGNVTANNGRLRASFGASGSGDQNAAAILADFAFAALPNGIERMPNGRILQWGEIGILDPTNIFFPVAFPNACLRVIVCEGAANPANWPSFPNLYGVGNFANNFFQGWVAAWSGSNWVSPATASTIAWYAIGF